MLANCHRLIACLVIMVAKPSEDPLTYIRRAGYKVMPGNRFALQGGEVYRLIFAVIPAVVLFSLIHTLVPLSSGGEIDWGKGIQSILRYILGALIILVFPVLLVLGFKRHMSMERSWRTVTVETSYDSFFDMPLSLYTLLSLIAWAGSTVLMVLTNSASSAKLFLEEIDYMPNFFFFQALFEGRHVSPPILHFPEKIAGAVTLQAFSQIRWTLCQPGLFRRHSLAIFTMTVGATANKQLPALRH